MGQELQLPDWAQSGVSSAFAVLNPQEDNLSDGIGQSYPVIGYKGKVWSFRHRGERKNFVRPDDGTPAAYLDVIILGQAKAKSKSFYEAYDPNNSEGGRPLCSSIDGVLPDPDVIQKQCDSCALCPRNQWKQQPNGKKGRECSDFKRLAVLVLPTQTAPLFGNVVEPAFLRVPAGSLNSLAIMGDTMSAKGFHYSSYITRITFDPQESHPKMVFRPLQPLSAGEAPVILQLREDMQVGRIINGGYAEGIRVVPPQEGTTLLPPGSVQSGLGAAPQQQVQQAQPQTLNLQANPGPSTVTAGLSTAALTNSPGKVSAQPAGQGGPSQQGSVQTNQPTPSTPVSTVATGLMSSGGAQPAPTQQVQQAQQQTVQQAVGDSGAPEAADQDLDSMIAGALQGVGKPN